MKTIGSSIAALAYGANINKDAVNLLADLRRQAESDLARFGIFDEQAKTLIEKAQTRVLAMCHLCESPIEQMMLAALGFMSFDKLDCFPPAIHDVMSGETWPTSPVVIIPQFVVARYRLDFLIVVESQPKPTLIAVECDGKEHHTKTSDIARDAARDEYLEKIGIHTWRLTGTEIFKHQWRMADELAHLVFWERRKVAA